MNKATQTVNEDIDMNTRLRGGTSASWLTKDGESDSVEPGTEVGQDPQEQAELGGVNEVFDQEQASELGQSGVHVRSAHSGCLFDFLLRQNQVHLQVLSTQSNGYANKDCGIFNSSGVSDLLERMSIGGLLDGLHDSLVHSEWNCSQQHEQRCVSDHTDDRVQRDGQQNG